MDTKFTQTEPTADDYERARLMGSLTARQYAAIHLRVPESGEPWLDEMIEQSRRDAFAGQLAPVILDSVKCDPPVKIVGPDDTEGIEEAAHRIRAVADVVAMMAYAQADAMLAARKGGSDAN